MRTFKTFVALLALVAALTSSAATQDTVRIQAGSHNIFGILNRLQPRPDGKPRPLAVFAHGFNDNYEAGRKYFEPLALQGYQTYTFDFPSGSTRSLSGNNTVDMSIPGEADALEAVIDHFVASGEADPSNIILIGESQGGFVSSIVASRAPEKVERLVLIYPALCIPDHHNSRFPDVDAIPEVADVWGVPLGRKFYTELRDLDPYAALPQYQRPVLIIHGDADPIVPLSYSQRAVATYPDARLHVIKGAGHGFHPGDFKQVSALVSKFVGKGSFAKGADVGWLSQLEAEGNKFYTPGPEREEMECMELLRDHCGVNSIRLRVWVNPKNGWNSIPDVMAKAKRASDLGLRTMIDFHFSDHWADPGQQEMPEAWKALSFEDLKKAMGRHVTETLAALRNIGVTPEWVQIGNETTPGMMLPAGSLDENPLQLTALFNAGYDAVKQVFPDAQVIIHLDNGNDRARFERMFTMLEKNGGRYDMIGMSVYPYWAEKAGEKGGWQKVASDAAANISWLRERYGRPVMVVEVGFPFWQGDDCARFIERLMTADTEGIFYWEPEAPAKYNGGYQLGCFEDGAPNTALTPFKN